MGVKRCERKSHLRTKVFIRCIAAACGLKEKGGGKSVDIVRERLAVQCHRRVTARPRATAERAREEGKGREKEKMEKEQLKRTRNTWGRTR